MIETETTEFVRLWDIKIIYVTCASKTTIMSAALFVWLWDIEIICDLRQ
jgi:hypothetical protein